MNKTKRPDQLNAISDIVDSDILVVTRGQTVFKGTVEQLFYTRDTLFAQLQNDFNTHGHAISDITDLQSNLDLLAQGLLTHTHAWGDITGKPTTFTPTSHSHPTSDITDLDTILSNINTSIASLEANKSEVGHTHDDRYFTESEVTTLLSGKANTTHTHTESDITDLDKYTQSEVDTFLSGKSDTGHTHTSSNITDFNSSVDSRITAQKGNANGLATLGSDSKIPSSQLPALAITETFVVASEVAQLALTVQEGDVAIRTDENKSYIALNSDNDDMGDWQELLTPTDAVLSVNGQTGAVSLDSDDISEGTNLYFTQLRARQSISETITGIDYDNTTGVFSITSGYGIPTTTKQGQWDTAFGWGDHASEGYITGIAWGAITGTLSSQSDLQSALNLKANLASPTFTGNINFPGSGIWNSSGNVGIGNTAPTNLLTVGNPTTTTNTDPTLRIQGQAISSGTVNYGSYGSMILNANTGYTSSARRYLVTNALDLNKFAIIRSTDATTDPSLGVAGALSSGVADFVINNSGNVGIGTTNPTSKSHIYGTSNISQTIETTSGTTDLFLKTGTANEARITFVQSGADKWQAGSNSVFDFFWYNYTQGGVQLRLKADGNTNLNEFSGKVGIGGTHTPVGMIDVRSRTATDTTAIFQGASAQTADLTEWRNGGGTTVAEVLADGTIRGLRLLAYGSGGITTNTAIGTNSLKSNTTGVNNTAIGYASLYSNTTGVNNTAIGYASLYLNTTGNQNTAVGYASLYLNTTGTSNTAIGVSSLYSNTTGTSNTALGYASLYLNTTGNQNTAVGYLSLNVNTTGVNNTAIGVSSLQSNTTANNNTAIGNSSLRYNTTGTSNTTIGVNSLYSNTTGNYNVSLGFQSLYNNTTGNQNVAIGFNTGYELNLTASENGNNVFLGYNTGRGIVTGVNNTILGANVTGLSSSLSNNIIIADGLGNRRINVDASGNVGIGTTTASSKVTVASGDVETMNAGSGIIVKTPDGTKRYRIAVDNSGVVTSTLV